MAKSVLPPGVQEVKFKDLTLYANLVEWTDSRKPRLATHEYLKRDGALIEPMGRAPMRVKMTLVFVGQTFVADFAKLSNSIDDDPKGTLVHPLYGSMQVACEGTDGATLNAEVGGNTYTVPISFIEDNVDVTTQIQSTGAAAQQQTVQTQSTTLTSNIGMFAAAGQAILNAASASLSFSTGALNAIQQSQLDPTLPSQLQGVNTLITTAITSCQTDPNFTSPIQVYDTVVDLEILLDACNQLWNAASVAASPLVTYTVPLQMHIANLAVKLYGNQGRDRIDEILTNNPGIIPNPSAIPQGTVLQVAQPTQTGV